MSLIVLLGCVALVAASYYLIPFLNERRRVYQLASKIQGPPALPILGNSLSFAFCRNLSELWRAFDQVTKGRDGIQRIWLGPVLVIVMDDPVCIEAVCKQSSFVKHPWYYVFEFGRRALFISNGKHYQRLRRDLDKFVHPKAVTNWHDFIAYKATQAIECLDAQLGKGEFDISSVTCAFNLDVVCYSVLGADLNEMKHNKFGFHAVMHKAVEISMERLFKPQYFNDFIFRITETGRKFEKYCLKTTALLRHIIETRITELEEREIDLKEDFEIENYTDAIIKVGYKEGLSLEDMAKMLCDIPVAGTDTSAVVSAFILFYLAMHPEHQQTAYEEQLTVLGAQERAPTIDEINRMPFLTQVKHEIHRLHGPPFVGRYSEDEVEIGDYTIPKGTTVIIAMQKLHSNPKYFDNPEKFNPYRFSPEYINKHPKNAFVPFLMGPRRCPGSLIVHLSVMTLVSILLRRYKFTTRHKFEELKCKLSFMLESDMGYPVEVVRRT